MIGSTHFANSFLKSLSSYPHENEYYNIISVNRCNYKFPNPTGQPNTGLFKLIKPHPLGVVRVQRLGLEAMPDGVLEYWSGGVLEKISRFLPFRVGLDYDPNRYSFWSFLIIPLQHSTTPVLHYSVMGFSKQSPFRGNSRPGPLGLDSLLYPRSGTSRASEGCDGSIIALSPGVSVHRFWVQPAGTEPLRGGPRFRVDLACRPTCIFPARARALPLLRV